MQNIKLTIAYDGTCYAGFQRQTNGVTVQEELEKALGVICAAPVTLTAAGRTDAGVHARGQVVNFRTQARIPTERIPLALNSLLPADIVVRAAEEVPLEFNARYDARSKIYRYKLLNHPIPCPFLRHYAWHVPRLLDVEAMAEAARHFLGTHDFTSFQAAGGAPVNPVRTLTRAQVYTEGSVIHFIWEGNGFLYHMVRNMVGTLAEVGLGKRRPGDIGHLLAAKNRALAGPTAPAHGLYLEYVKY